MFPLNGLSFPIRLVIENPCISPFVKRFLFLVKRLLFVWGFFVCVKRFYLFIFFCKAFFVVLFCFVNVFFFFFFSCFFLGGGGGSKICFSVCITNSSKNFALFAFFNHQNFDDRPRFKPGAFCLTCHHFE